LEKGSFAGDGIAALDVIQSFGDHPVEFGLCEVLPQIFVLMSLWSSGLRVTVHLLENILRLAERTLGTWRPSTIT